MGHEIHSGLSPAHRRNQNPASPSASMFKRIGSQLREETDHSWTALLRRHRFLLLTLGLLTFLCTIYLYFAITLGADKCSSLSGNEKALCHLRNSKLNKPHGRRSSRGLLSTENLLGLSRLEHCSSDYSHYSSCQFNQNLKPCRKKGDQPPFCRIPLPWGYHKPHFESGVLSLVEPHSVMQRTSQLRPKVHEQEISMSGSHSIDELIMGAAPFSGDLFIGQVLRILHISCKKGSWVEQLWQQYIVTIAISGTRICEDRVEMLLEKGFPSIQLAFAQEKLPFLDGSFDLILCDECDVPWNAKDGRHLLEMGRLLRNGGFFLWVSTLASESFHIGGVLPRFSETTNWIRRTRFGGMSLWQKQRVLTINRHDVVMEQLSKPGQFVDNISMKAQHIVSDRIKWRKHINEYKHMLRPGFLNQIRNVLDMNSGLGSFAAGLTKDRVWVMNVVPVDDSSMIELPEKGVLPALQQDWCEAFPSPPRSYELVHASGVVELEEKRCDMFDVLLEIDRLLRPGAIFILHDTLPVVKRAQILARVLNWQEIAMNEAKLTNAMVLMFQKQ